MTITVSERPATVSEVILGIDTHKEVHVAVALDGLGGRLGELKVPTTMKGYQRLLWWAEGLGPVCCAGVEGTGSYGAGLARQLKAAGIPVVEVERPKRRHLRRNGKSDPIDAEAAAKAVLADDTAGEPKSGDGPVEMIWNYVGLVDTIRLGTNRVPGRSPRAKIQSTVPARVQG